MNMCQHQKWKSDSYNNLHAIQVTNPILCGFLAQQTHRKLLYLTLKHPHKPFKHRLDTIFKMHLAEIRLRAYFSTLIERYALDVVKRERKHEQHFLLIFDQETPNDSFSCIGEKLVYKQEPFNPLMIEGISLKMFKLHILKNLTLRERHVIIDYYFHQLHDVDIACKFNVTQQAIWKTRHRALKKIATLYKEGF